MDSRLRERWFGSLAPLIIALVTLASAKTVDAQENPTPEIGQEALTELGIVHRAMMNARDDYFDGLGRTHDTLGRAQLLEAHEEEVAQILIDHEMTEEEYQRLIFVISSDQEQRQAFEAILAELESGGLR